MRLQGKVSTHTHTPLAATAATAVSVGLIAVVVDLEALADLVSIGALAVFYTVAVACIYRRYACLGVSPPALLCMRLLCLTCAAAGASLTYVLEGPAVISLACAGADAQASQAVSPVGWHSLRTAARRRRILLGAAGSGPPPTLVLVRPGIWLIATGSLAASKVVWRPASFAVPFAPLTPSLAVFANTHLILSLGSAAWLRFAVWLALTLAVYVVICLRASPPPYARPVDLGQEMSVVAPTAGHSRASCASTAPRACVSPRTPRCGSHSEASAERAPLVPDLPEC